MIHFTLKKNSKVNRGKLYSVSIDVENFPNKFTAEYLFLKDQTNSAIPRVNTSSRVRKNELDKEWERLKMQGNEFLEKELPEFNKKLWEAGIGAIRYEK